MEKRINDSGCDTSGQWELLSFIITSQDQCCIFSSLLGICHYMVRDSTAKSVLIGFSSLDWETKKTTCCSWSCGHPQCGNLLPESQQRRSTHKTHTATLYKINTVQNKHHNVSVVHTCNSSAWEAEVGGLWLLGQSDYQVRYCLKTTNKG